MAEAVSLNLEEASQIAMSLVNQGKAQIAMKGNVSTALFLRAALDRKTGLRTGRLLSHVATFDMVSLNRLLLISDAGVNIAPNLEQKADIVRNAIGVAHKLGILEPRVAVLASTETVNPRIPANVEAAALAKMADDKAGAQEVDRTRALRRRDLLKALPGAKGFLPEE